MLRLLAGTAFMAIGVVVVAALLGALLFVPDLVDAIALAGARLFSADDLIRRDMLQDLAFEAAFAWTLAFLAILFWRGRAACSAFNPKPEGGDHGN